AGIQVTAELVLDAAGCDLALGPDERRTPGVRQTQGLPVLVRSGPLPVGDVLAAYVGEAVIRGGGDLAQSAGEGSVGDLCFRLDLEQAALPLAFLSVAVE